MSKIWYVLAFSLLGAGWIPAQDIGTTFDRAKQAESCQERVYLLERCLFFLRNDSLQTGRELRVPVIAELGRAYGVCGDAQQANEYLRIAEKATVDDTLKQEILFERAKFLIVAGEYGEAGRILEFFYADAMDEQELRTDFYQGMVAFLDGKYAASEGWFHRCASNEFHKAYITREIKEMKGEMWRLKPKVATTLSMIFPGAGQVYAGNYRQALNSLLLTGAIVAGGVYIGLAVAWVDAVVLAGPTFWRYYRGGAKRAAELVRQKENEKRRQTLERIIDSFEAF